MMMMNKRVLGLLVAALLPLALAYGESRFSFSADRTRSVLSKGSERTILSGNVIIETDKTHIEADEVELYGEDFRFALCTGDIVVREEARGIVLKSNNLYFDREREISIMRGYNEMEDHKNGLVVKSSYLEDRAEENLTIMQIGVRLLRNDEDGKLICRSEVAHYNREDSTLSLSGFPRVNWKGDEYIASRIDMNLDTDEITLLGEVTGNLVFTGEEE